jgi:hypothetical protein
VLPVLAASVGLRLAPVDASEAPRGTFSSSEPTSSASLCTAWGERRANFRSCFAVTAFRGLPLALPHRPGTNPCSAGGTRPLRPEPHGILSSRMPCSGSNTDAEPVDVNHGLGFYSQTPFSAPSHAPRSNLATVSALITARILTLPGFEPHFWMLGTGTGVEPST